MIRNKTVRNTAKFLLKVLLSAFAVYVVTRRLDVSKFVQIFQQVAFFPIILAVVLFAASKMFSVMKTDALLRNTGVDLRFHSIVKFYWMGMFYNQFLPGGIGGDAYKVAMLKSKKSVNLRDGAGIVINDRLSGLLALWILVMVLYYILRLGVSLDYFLWCTVPLALAVYFLFLKRFYPATKRIFPSIMLYAFSVQLTQLFMVILLMMALDLHEHYLAYLFIFGLSSLASNIPVSVGGIGVRELVFLTGAQYFDLIPEESVFISMTFYFISLFAAIPGIIWVFRSPLLERPDSQEQSSGQDANPGQPSGQDATPGQPSA